MGSGLPDVNNVLGGRALEEVLSSFVGVLAGKFSSFGQDVVGMIARADVKWAMLLWSGVLICGGAKGVLSQNSWAVIRPEERWRVLLQVGAVFSLSRIAYVWGVNAKTGRGSGGMLQHRGARGTVEGVEFIASVQRIFV